MATLTSHRVQPLDLLDVSSKSFHADIKLIMEMIIALSGSGASEFFEIRANLRGRHGSVLLCLLGC